MTHREIDFLQDAVVRWTGGVAGVAADEVRIAPLPYSFGSPATAGLWKVAAGGTTWCVKWIRHTSLWPGIAFIPPQFRQQFADDFPWRFELDMAESGIDRVMPPGLRTARLDRVVAPDALNAVMWWEWIDDDGSPWGIGDYTVAALGLGRLAARRREGAAANDSLPSICREIPRGYALRMYAERRTLAESLPRVRELEVGAHPEVLGALAAVGEGIWDELLALGARIPGLLDELDALPQAFAHGDASPQNLLRPPDEPGTVVAIDWGFGSLLAVGFDLGQLLVGLVHAGVAPASGIPELVGPVLSAYVDGLRTEGWDVPEEVVRRGFVASVLCRSALDSLPLDQLGEQAGPDAARLWTERLSLVRVLLDLDVDGQ
ncbi:MAG: phosphotransferase [Candidatus Nanopelagicales bacterium]